MTEHETVPSAAAFNQEASEYDALRRRLIPCFDDFYGAALRLLAESSPGERPRVLDLGAGTGLFSAMILERFPRVRLRLVDASEPMLDEARQRFSGRDGVEFQVADMARVDLGTDWDAVVSALAIHHLEDEEKRDLFSRIRAALAPGGLFVNAEQVLGPSPAAEARYRRIWNEDIRALGVSEEQVAAADRRMSFDRCAPVEDQLGWMRAAGFADVDCSFKSWRFAVLSGRAG